MNANQTALPAPSSACRLTVVIPARNEAAFLPRALQALLTQRDLDGNALAAGVFDIIVLANNCSDATARVGRDWATTSLVPIYVLEADFAVADAHVGVARKAVMDLAALRFQAAGFPNAVIASTDADTVVDSQWIAWTLHELPGVDAVAGQVRIGEGERERMYGRVQTLYSRELTYRRLVAEVETLIDPVAEDPVPRHSSFVGASFAVTTAAYFAAGGLPPLRQLEDQQFCCALRRIDARIRHSTRVRATTSGRISAHVDGGFGTFIAGLHHSAGRHESFRVEHPRQTLAAFSTRAALRKMWRQRNSESVPLSSQVFGSPISLADDLRESPTFGIFLDRVTARCPAVVHADVEVDYAIDVLRAVF